MDEIRSGSILKSVPDEMRPRPEVTLLHTAQETIRVKSTSKKVIRLSQLDLMESDSEEEDVLSLQAGFTIENMYFIYLRFD